MNSAASLIDQARQRTGHVDLGDDGFREGLERLLDALDREARLNAMGRAAMDAQILDLLCHRLEVEHWYTRHPEIEDEVIVQPLVGLGLPRTGSTALACLLGEDRAARSLLNWEAMRPCPPPEAASRETDPRIDLARQSMDRRASLFPRMPAMLPSTATSPTECQLFMGYDFKSQLFQAFAHIPSYVAWLNHEADLVPTYRYVRRVLKLLQWRCPPRRWRLKNPSHSLFITAFDTVFPDARYVMTHREVAEVIPSVSDLYLELSRAYSDAPDLHHIGRETAECCELAMRRMIAFRAAGHEHRFFDIHFAPFQADPFPIIAALYAFLGEALTEETLAAMARWREDRPLASRSYQRTPPEAFGLDPAELRQRFGFYAERFGKADQRTTEASR